MSSPESYDFAYSLMKLARSTDLSLAELWPPLSDKTVADEFCWRVDSCFDVMLSRFVTSGIGVMLLDGSRINRLQLLHESLANSLLKGARCLWIQLEASAALKKTRRHPA
jgi:hypothetical protein